MRERLIKNGYFICLLSFFLLISCQKEKGGQGTKSSERDNTESHNVGTSCMQCHNSGSDNEFWFSVAGTVYRNDMSDLFPNCTIYLFPDSTGTSSPRYTLAGDAKANFYTTAEIIFGNGLFAVVKSKGGSVAKMKQAVTSGDCNSCHNEGKRIIIP